ncbi:VanZ family protein [Verrucomicrobiaceae bacterium N1E253]|uniref:VanZ family protein n=1 Tax=Oceaniferula marina TaxID=2748318 RepID=A0A851GLA0_9BACT|nr:VanZ family protein [Oceaniferula marina]NWK56611.1 VanZ family protein [Oceaniferula marina]
MITTWLPRRPVVYLFFFVSWLVTLWFLSAGNPAPKNGPEIPHVDKVAHFVYFAIGGGLMMAYAYYRWPLWRRFRLRMVMVVFLLSSVIGRLDEYHQTFTPGRSGNDTGDWIADSLGGLFGASVMVMVLLPGLERRKRDSDKPRKSQIVANSLD